MSDVLTIPNTANQFRGPKVGLRYLRQLQKDPLSLLAHERDTFGDIVRFNIVFRDSYLISDPALIETILVREHGSIIKDILTRELRHVMGNGLLTSERDSWKRERKLAAPPFTKRAITSYATDMVEIAKKHVAVMAVDTARDIHHDLMELTLDIVVRTLFGSDLPTHNGKDVGAALDVAMDHFLTQSRSLKRLIPRWVPLPANRRLKRAVRIIDATLNEVIAKRRAETTDEANDLISLLLRARDDEGSGLTDAQLRDEAVTIFLAGHETVALALSYAVYLLAAHPEQLALAHAEVNAVLGDRPATFADMAKLEFLDSVIAEAMRLYPPAWIVAREVAEPFAAGGCNFAKGAQIWMSQWVVHRDPRWFDRPNDFVPDRWTDEFRDKLPRFAYFPFGGGPRICIGNHFALMESVLVLATILQKLTFEVAQDNTIELDCSVTLRPKHGIRLIPRAF